MRVRRLPCGILLATPLSLALALPLSGIFLLAQTATSQSLTYHLAEDHPPASSPGAARPLVLESVDPDQRVTLRGNVHPIAKERLGTASDLGQVDGSLAVNGLYLLLKRPEDREAALHQFLADVQTPGSADYGKWLKPEEFGQRFGPADSDLAALKAWLESQNLQVGAVHPGRIAISFSGSAAAIAAAFKTEIHQFTLDSPTSSSPGSAKETPILLANVTDPSIPAAFQSLVAAISPIQSTRSQAQTAVKESASYDPKTHTATPLSTSPDLSASPNWTYPSASGTVYEMAPADLAVQYGLTSISPAGTTGAGQTIGIVSDSNVDLSLVTAYQTLFKLPATVPIVVVDGNDPGITEDATETYADLEEAAAVAPGANLILYTSAGTLLNDGLLVAAMRAVADNEATVLSVSYASCEASLGAGGNAAWAALWQEAAAQGISVFVTAGDSGSAGCDNPENTTMALSGLAVNGLASTPYDTAVGGTDLYYSSYAAGGSALAAQIAGYWSATTSTSPAASLLKTVPEQAWNDSFGFNTSDAGAYSAARATIAAGGGGASSAAVVTASGAFAGYAKPAWQSGTGVPADSVRDIPDVALFAGDGANSVYLPACAMPGDCVNTNAAGAVVLTSVGGTSVATPIMAGIQALVNAATGALNGRSGLTAGIYYALATKYAAATVKPFNDVITGTNQVPCYAGTQNCTLGTSGQAKGVYAESGYPAAAGYDLASGLGSVNAATLIADWPALARKATATALTLTPTTLAHGTAATAKVTVAPSSGAGTPTGNAAVISSSQQPYANGLGAVTLAGAAGTMSLSNLPGGTYQLTAEYGGDTSFAPSLSLPVTVTVSQEQDTLVTSGWVVNPLDGATYPLSTGMQIPYGAELYLDAQPTGVNEVASASTQNAPATGSVAFTDKGSAATRTGTAALNVVGVAEWAPGVGTVGTHAVSAAYAGDASYAASSAATAASYTVFKGTTTIYLSPLQTTVASGGSVTVDVQLFSQYLPLIGTLPTGSVTVTLGGQSKTATWSSSGPAGSGQSSSGPAGSAIEEAIVNFTAVPAGILPLSASYPGDTNWNGSSALWGSIDVTGSKAIPTVALTASAASLTPAQSLTLKGTVTGPSGSTTAPTGSMTVSWNGGASSYTGTVTAAGTNSASYAVTVPAYALQNGTNLLVASYSGDGNYAAASSTPVTITLAASDFSISATTPEVAVTYGKTGTASVALAPINGFSSAISVSCVAPTGITCAVGTSPVTIGSGATDTITLTIGAGLATGAWPVNVIGTGGGHTHSAQILVAATPQAPAPTFTPPAGSYTTSQLVTIADAAAAATIYYTTNGTTPTTSSTKYAGPISVTATETINAIATAPGYLTSAASSAAYTITPVTATPLISPAGGTFPTTQSVTITDATSGATIFYTTNGATPTAASTKYTGAISVAASETIDAIATATGYGASAVASAAFTIAPPAAAPTFSPAAGSYAAAQSVTIADTTTGAAIYYTTDGSTPTTASNKYAGAIPVATSETIKAIATATSYTSSAVASAAYTITVAATPTFSPAAGSYTSTQSVTIADATTGSTIYYTTNGTTPTTASTKYAGAIPVAATETIKAIAAATGYTTSAAASATYTITAPAATAVPTFSPAPGTYTTAQTITITDATTGSVIYYTTNGTAPTTASTKYAGPISVSATETIEAIAVANGQTSSPVAVATYTITPVAATPTFSPAAGTYTATQSVSMADATTGATIYYTTNGTTPTTSSTRYTTAISVPATETIKAIAAATGYSTSAVASAAYTITPVTATPSFTPAAGTYSTTQSVTIADTTSGAVIYYTMNGTAPTTASTKYTRAISVAATETIKAIAVATGYAQSAVATAVFTITPTAATPVFSPVAGTYPTKQSVTISDTTAGATIYYTTNGTTPTTASTKYTAVIPVTATETIHAIAVAAGYIQSAMATAAYTISSVTATPVISPAGGSYSKAQSVTITDAISGAAIYYTTNGTTPSTASTKYAGAITVAATETIHAIAIATGYTQSAVATAAYTITSAAAGPGGPHLPGPGSPLPTR